ncbi:MAG: glycosyltransferase [Sulfuricurvum sp.]|nr:glycosyltransferase [Sulfuricurvum sp.]
MKIVHVANYNYLKDGQSYYATDYKIHQGLVRNGHFVYPFSYRDTARCANIFGSKKWGDGKTNKRLIETCRNIRPDLLLMAHAELITLETLREIRKMLPSIKIAMWFVDAMFNERNVINIEGKSAEIDALFLTTGGEWLERFASPTTKVSFFPNLVDPSIDVYRNFESDDLPIDFLFCGTDYKDPVRQAFLNSLSEQLSDINTRFAGCLGQPRIFGAEYMQTLSQAQMGLNYSRRNDVELYSSDRIAHLTGNGVLTFTPRIPGYEALYTEEEVVYFDDLDDLIAKVHYYHQHQEEGAAIAKRGWEKAHTLCTADRVVKEMEDVIF